MEPLEVYIPTDRRLALASGESLPDRAEGAVLFADVSGFTPLTDALARELGQRRGAEELTQQLNRVYDALIAQIHQFGGSVIFFSGDAITCWFSGKDEGRRMKDESSSAFILHPSSFCAVACALQLQQAMTQFAAVATPSGVTVSLAIKVAITAGPVRRFLVGDPDIQYLDVLAGQTLTRMAQIEHQAEKGEILVGPEIMEHLAGQVRVTEWRTEPETGQRLAVISGLVAPSAHLHSPVSPAAEQITLSEAQTRPWLLPPVYERVKAGRGRFLAELRTAVSFFISFKGIDYDSDDAAGDKLDAYIRWVQNVVNRYQGYILQLTIGDKGSYLYISFGAPLAHGDDASRAVAAALELRAPPPALSFIQGVQIGLSQGRMRVGAYGSQTRRTYGVLGGEANIAARLMGKAAPGQILASKHVAEAAAKNFEFQYLATSPVKGRTEPIPIFEVLGRRVSTPAQPVTLIGRETALTQLDQVLDLVAGGSGQVLRLEGVASVGKSHLAADFIQQAGQRGFQIARGVCPGPEQQSLYAPWRQMFRAWFDLRDTPAEGEDSVAWLKHQIAQLEAVINDIDPDWLPLYPLLRELLDLPIPDNETTAIFPTLLRQGTLFALAVEMIKTWAVAQPSLLIIDDAHWLDEASQGLALALSRSISSTPVLLTLVHRSPQQPDKLLLPELNRLPHYNHLNLHGKAEPVALNRFHSQKPLEPQLVRSTLVGRAAERALLGSRLDALLQGSNSTVSAVIVEGEAGIGKSRLVADLLEQAQAMGVTCLLGGGDAIEQSTLYHAWRPLFRQLFNLENRSNASTVARRNQVLSLLPATPELLRLVPLLNAVLSLGLQENDLTRQMSGQVRADNTRDLLLNLLQTAAAQSPTLILLEDAHWLDSASWALTRLVCQHVRPVLLLVVARPLVEPLPLEYQQLLQIPGVRRLKLEALSPEETLQLVCQRLAVKSLPEPVTALIQTKAEGHPFFSEELAYALRDAGLIRISEGQCYLASDATAFNAVTLPDTVEDVITSRIDRLVPPQQLILKIASVIGRSFAFVLLHDIHPVETDRPYLPNHLDLLARLDITLLEKPEPDLTYTFKHVITREVAYNLMLFDQRRELHRAVAEWFEQTYGDDLLPFYSILAYHWSQAIGSRLGNSTPAIRALDYLEKAGEQALRGYANQEAARFFSEAISISKTYLEKSEAGINSAPDPIPALRRSRWERQLGEAYLGLGQLAESRAHLEQAVALLGWPQPGQRVTRATSLLGLITQQIGHRLWPGSLTNSSPETKEALLEVARTYERLGEIYYWSNETLRAIYAALRTLNLAERVGPSPELARAYANMCLAAGFASLRSLADSYSRRALVAAQSAGHRPALAWVLELTGVYAIGIGHWAKAHDTLEEGVRVAHKLEDRRRWEECSTALSDASLFQGKFGDSLKLWPDIYTSARRRDDTQAQSWGLAGQLRSLLALGQAQSEQALTTLQTLKSLLDEDIGSTDKINSYGVVALMHWHLEQPEQAQQAVETAVSLIAESSPTGFGIIHGYTHVAEVCLALWEAEMILDFRLPILDLAKIHNPKSKFQNLKWNAQQSCQALRQYARAFPIGQPRAWLWQGLFEWLSGQPAKAHRAWHRSLAMAERLAMPYEQAQALYEMGRHLPAADSKRRDYLSRAVEGFAQLNAAYALARAQQALGGAA